MLVRASTASRWARHISTKRAGGQDNVRRSETRKRIRLIVPVLVAVCALGGATASTSMAVTSFCLPVAETPARGNRPDTQCRGARAAGLPYILIKTRIPGTNQAGTSIWCAETFENGTGNWENPDCSEGTVGKYIKVDWVPTAQITGVVPAPGARQPVKQQLKGTATLAVPAESLTIECKGSRSELAAFESQGKNHAGQGKGRISYSSCKTSVSECAVAEPIITNQVKRILL